VFLRQSFVEWPDRLCAYSQWAQVYYERMAQKGKKHAVIIRALRSNGFGFCGSAGRSDCLMMKPLFEAVDPSAKVPTL